MYDERMSDKQPLTRLTVNLIPRADRALTIAAEKTGDTRTDTVNRALQFYAYFVQEITRGRNVYVGDSAGDLEKITIL